MTQSHLPRSGRGVIEAAIKMLHMCNVEYNLPFRMESGFFCFGVSIVLTYISQAEGGNSNGIVINRCTRRG